VGTGQRLPGARARANPQGRHGRIRRRQLSRGADSQTGFAVPSRCRAWPDSRRSGGSGVCVWVSVRGR
jgi:hypothetical protein